MTEPALCTSFEHMLDAVILRISSSVLFVKILVPISNRGKSAYSVTTSLIIGNKMNSFIFGGSLESP